MKCTKGLIASVFLAFIVSPIAIAKGKKGKFVCEAYSKKKKKHVIYKKISKKRCEKMKGEWIPADHDHDSHEHGGHDHDH